jgi:hypothetical protein
LPPGASYSTWYDGFRWGATGAIVGDFDMNEVLLHTAARRYCLQRHAYWCERYSEILNKGGDRRPDRFHYSDEALATFPRYNVLNAIRVEIERIDPAGLGDLETTRALLILAGEMAEDHFTRSMDKIAQRAMGEEREAFCRYVREFPVVNLNEVEALPFRRVLSDQESKEIWSRLRGRWQIPDGGWYPLADCTLPDVVAFKSEAFYEAIPHQRLQNILAARGIERVWELREYGPEYEEDVSLFEPFYNGAEGYWSSGELDWIIYASHASSITVGGWLLQSLKRVWPSWQAKVWDGSFD